MNASNINKLKWLTGGLEAFLGIPLIGAMVILSFSWAPLAIMLILHIIVVAIAYRNGMKATGNILGIVTSLVGWIPFLGMILYILSAIFILVDAANNHTLDRY